MLSCLCDAFVLDEWRKELRDLTGYDPSKFAGVDEEEATESNLYKVQAEEQISELLGKREDLEELKKSFVSRTYI